MPRGSRRATRLRRFALWAGCLALVLAAECFE